MEFFFFEVNPRRVWDGVVRADLIDEATAARSGFVGDDDTVEGVLLRAAACEPDRDAHSYSFRPGSAGNELREGIAAAARVATAEFGELFHHLFRLCVLFEEPVDVCDTRSATERDA